MGVTSLAAELATAPCVIYSDEDDREACGAEPTKHPECIASFLEALRRDNPAKLADLLGLTQVGWEMCQTGNPRSLWHMDTGEHAGMCPDCRPLYAFTPEASPAPTEASS